MKGRLNNYTLRYSYYTWENRIIGIDGEQIAAIRESHDDRKKSKQMMGILKAQKFQLKNIKQKSCLKLTLPKTLPK